MSIRSKKSTIYFEPDIHLALKSKAAATQQSVSEIVNKAVRLSLDDDQLDLNLFHQKIIIPKVNYEELLGELETHDKV